MDGFLDRKLSQWLLVAANQLVARYNLRSIKHSSFHLDRLRLDDQVPVLYRLLLEKLFDHFLDLVHFLVRTNSGLHKSLSHASRLTHALRHTVKQAEFSREVVGVLRDLDQEERLFGHCDLLFVTLRKVVCYWNLLVIAHKPARYWILIKDNIIDKVSALVAPVCDDAFTAKFELHPLLPHALARGFVFNLQNSIETTLGRHELEDRIHHQGAPHLALKCGSFEPGPDL